MIKTYRRQMFLALLGEFEQKKGRGRNLQNERDFPYRRSRTQPHQPST